MGVITITKKFGAALTAGIILAACFGSVAQAGPLSNYDAGRFEIHAGGNIPNSTETGNHKMRKKNSAYFGGTVGLGSNVGLNYKWDELKGRLARMRAQEVNLMYRFIPCVSFYAGYLNADAKSTSWRGNGYRRNSAHVGLQADVNVPELFDVWANFAYGSKHNYYEIGLSKPIIPNIDFDVSYYHQKYDDALRGDDTFKGRGIKVGLTVKI